MTEKQATTSSISGPHSSTSRNDALLTTIIDDHPQQEQHGIVNSSFPAMVQAGAVAAYVLADTILRFMYQQVIVGSENDDGTTTSNVIESSSYDKPLMLSYTCYTAFILWSIPMALYVWFVKKQTIKEFLVTSWAGDLGFEAAVKRCAPVVLLLIFQNYLYVAALRYIRVAISTAVGQSEAPFTVFLTVSALGRRLGKTESKGVILSFTGIALITIPPLFSIADHDEGGDNIDTTVGGTLLGIGFTIAAAFLFSLYQIFWQDFDQRRFQKSKQQQPSTPVDSIIDTMATITIIGLCNIFLGPFLLGFAHVCRIETIELPPWSAAGPILGSCLLSAFVDAMNGVACVVASAVIVAMAYPLTIPLSVLIEAAWSGIPLSTWGLWGWIGTVMVVIGIFFLENDDIDLECDCVDIEKNKEEEEEASLDYSAVDDEMTPCRNSQLEQVV